MASKKDDCPCGLYRTTEPLPDREDKVAADRLVFYHNHSEQGPPLVLTPHINENNTWQFHERGWLVKDEAWSETLIPLLPEGYYLLNGHLHLTHQEEVLPEKTLVQLGYDRGGHPILFPAQFHGNAIAFPDSGFGFDEKVLKTLKPAGFLVPNSDTRRPLH